MADRVVSESIRLLERLSFVAMRDGKALPKPQEGQHPRCFWHVQGTGNYHIDTEIGVRLAMEYLTFEESDIGGPGLLNMIVEDMPKPLTGVEQGFLQMVSFAVGAGAGHARRVKAHWDKCAVNEAA